MKFMNDPRYEEAKRMLFRLLNALRKDGVRVIANQADCSTCSWALVNPQDKEVAMYHQQGWEDFQNNGILHIYYGVAHTEDRIGDRQLGNKIANFAGMQNIPVVWDGNPDKAIKLVFSL